MAQNNKDKTQHDWLIWYMHWANFALQLAAQKATPEAAETLRKKMVQGIEFYQAYDRVPYQTPYKVVWESGSTKLLHFGTGKNRPLIIIPSLINKYNIVDLRHDLSLVKSAIHNGFSVYVVDWGEPGEAEIEFDFDAYIQKRLSAIIRYVQDAEKQAPACLGYCLGGTLLAGLLARWPDAAKKIHAAVYIGTPWDFHAGGNQMDWRLFGYHEICKAVLAQQKMLPASMVQMGFALIDPVLWVQKFITLSEKSEAFIKDFVAVEDWLNQPVNLAKPAALQLMDNFYRNNQPLKKEWILGFEKVDLLTCYTKSLVICAASDKIVPNVSALALAKQLPKAEFLMADTGHIGLLASRRVAPEVWDKIFNFIK